MYQFNFEESIGYWLTITSHAVHRALTEELAPHGITYRQGQVLLWLVVEQEISQAQLASKMLIEPPTLVGVLDRMERDGWICRQGCEKDRRKKLIRINPSAEPILDKIGECVARVRSQMTQGLSDEQIDTLRGLLRRVGENLEQRAAAESELKLV